MTKLSSIKKLTITAVCIALSCVLPVAFHTIGLGSSLSPLHIPALLCGMVCGGFYGLACGVIGTLMSTIVSGMPPAAFWVYMIPELAVYGLVTGLCMRYIRTKNLYADMYISMAIAMILGRVIGGIARALFYTSSSAFTLAVWASSYFVGTLPGIICHLILIPLLVVVLTKVRLIPKRY